MSEEQPAGEVLRRARRYRPAAKQVGAVFRDGMENLAYLIDGDLILKHARPGQPRDWLTREASILGTISGRDDLPVPQFVGYDADDNLPVLCESFVPGATLESLPHLGAENRSQLLREVGRVLARLHEIVPRELTPDRNPDEAVHEPCVGRHPGLVRRWQGGMETVRTEELINAADCDWLEAEFNRVLVDCPDQPPVLLHKDIRPGHVLVLTEPPVRLAGIIDFGDAGLGPREIEFYYAWLRWWPAREDVAALVDSYVSAWEPPEGFRTRVDFLRIASCVSRVQGRVDTVLDRRHPELRELALKELWMLLG